MWKTAVAVAFTALAVTLARPLLAQAPAPSAALGADALLVLTAELRALRSELVEITRANTRTQLLVARLQMQEQRIINLDRERAATSAKLAESEQMRTMMSGAMTAPIAQGGVFIGGGPAQGGANFPPGFDEREAMQRVAEQMKAQLATVDANIERLRAQESEMAAALATEQSRWNDYNTRLDELERVLSGR
jgi:hypothetical protein